MEARVVNPHSPSEERLLSDLGHWIEGAIITAAGISSVRAAVTGDERHEAHRSAVLIAAGSLLGLGLVAGSFHHGGPAAFFRADAQQREHLEMAGLIAAAGTLRRLGRAGAALSNALVARVGQMFLMHQQHGTDEAAARSKRRHEVLGKTVVAAATAGALGDLTRRRSMRALAGGLMVAAGVQLVTYREPEGAYEADHRAPTGSTSEL